MAAAVSSVFALRLQAERFSEAHAIVPETFLVITGTVVVYGLTAGLLARRLGISDPDPQGLLLAGANDWARAVARVLVDHGLRVVLVDTNRDNVAAAKMEGFEAHAESILAAHAWEDIDLGGIGRLIAATPNDWVNSLAAQRFARIFGRSEVYQVPPVEAGGKGENVHRHLHGRWLFSRDLTYGELAARMRRGAIIKATPLTDEFTFDTYREHYRDRAWPLFIIKANGRLNVVTVEKPVEPKAGDVVVGLVEEESVQQSVFSASE